MAVAEKLRIQEKGLALRDDFSIKEGENGAQKREVVIISAGWGSSGYYSEEVLERDIPRIFPVGSHMYLNHPTEREDMERPERNVLDLVGTIVEAPRLAGADMVAVVEIYEHWIPVIEAMAKDIGLSIRAFGITEEGEAGGKKGNIIVSLTEGLSVDYVTKAGAGGKIGELVESAREKQPDDHKELVERRNAAHWLEAKMHREFTWFADDLFGSGYITREERKALSGAIGAALDVFSEKVKEDAPKLLLRDPYADPEGEETDVEESDPGSGDRDNNKEDEMSGVSESDFAELKGTVDDLKESADAAKEATKTAESERDEEKAGRERAEDALQLNRAASVAAEAIRDDKYKDLPGTAKARAVEAALKDLPQTEDKKLDESKLKDRVAECAKSEADYLAEAGATAVSGFGGRTSEDDDAGKTETQESKDKKQKELQSGFERAGMSEAAARHAAEGR